MKLDDKSVLVTGAAKGIGRALALRFAAEGSAGVCVVDRNADLAEEVAHEIGDRAFAFPADVGIEADTTSAVSAAEERFGRLDLLVCNAGVNSPGVGVGGPTDTWQRLWNINVMAHVWAARTALPGMLQRGGGYIMTTSSAAGVLTDLGDAPYSVTKHASVGFAEWLAITYGDEGIKVSCLCPQGVDTPQMRRSSAAGGLAGRVVSSQGLMIPEELASMVVDALDEERFFVFPQPEIAEFYRRRATDTDRWLNGMRKLQQRMHESPPSDRADGGVVRL